MFAGAIVIFFLLAWGGGTLEEPAEDDASVSIEGSLVSIRKRAPEREKEKDNEIRVCTKDTGYRENQKECNKDTTDRWAGKIQ